jgi:hypothetical protein
LLEMLAPELLLENQKIKLTWVLCYVDTK